MSLMDAFGQACNEFTEFREAVVQARDLADPGTRAELEHLLQSLDQSFSELQESFPKAVADIQQRFTAVEKQAKATEERTAAMKDTLAKHEAQEAAAPRPTLPKAATPEPAFVLPTMAALNLEAGLRAREELLQRFGTHKPDTTPMDDEDIWQGLSRAGDPLPKAQAPTGHPSSAGQKPDVDEEDKNIWKGLSSLE